MPTIQTLMDPTRLGEIAPEFYEDDVIEQAVGGTPQRWSGSGGVRLIWAVPAYIYDPTDPMPEAYIKDWERYRQHEFVRHEITVSDVVYDLILTRFTG